MKYKYLSFACLLCALLVMIVDIRKEQNLVAEIQKEYEWRQNLKRKFNRYMQVLSCWVAQYPDPNATPTNPNPALDKEVADFNDEMIRLTLDRQKFYEPIIRDRKKEQYWYRGIAIALAIAGGLMFWFHLKRNKLQA